VTARVTDHLVVFTPSGRRGRFETGTTVLDAARRLGVDIDSVCGGRGICGRCQVEVSEGDTVLTLSMNQAVFRALGMAALSGNQRAQDFRHRTTAPGAASLAYR